MAGEVSSLVKRFLCYDRRGFYGREACEELVDELLEKGFVCMYHPDKKRRTYRYLILEKWRSMGLLEKRRQPICGGFGKTRVCYYPRREFIIAMTELLDKLTMGAQRRGRCVEPEEAGMSEEEMGPGPW